MIQGVISIIIPVLNEASTLEATLLDLLSMGGEHEIIVVDGGSTDRTVAIASQYAKVLSMARGRARQMNAGAAEAKGDVLLFLHADTRLPRGAIAGIWEAFSDPTVVGGRFRVSLSNPAWVYRLIALGINARDRFLGGFTGDQAIFVRAEVFRALGGYREMPLMEDLDFGNRMARTGRVARLPLSVITSSRRWERNGVVRTVVLMWVLRLLYILGCPPSRLEMFYGETR